MAQTKQERYNELASMDDEAQTDEEMTEQTQLFYELNPDGWNSLCTTTTPQQQYGVDTSMYK